MIQLPGTHLPSWSGLDNIYAEIHEIFRIVEDLLWRVDTVTLFPLVSAVSAVSRI